MSLKQVNNPIELGTAIILTVLLCGIVLWGTGDMAKLYFGLVALITLFALIGQKKWPILKRYLKGFWWFCMAAVVIGFVLFIWAATSFQNILKMQN